MLIIWAFYDMRRRLRELENRQSKPVSKHDLSYLAKHEIGEALMFKFLILRDKLMVEAELADNFAKQAKAAAQGCRIDDLEK